MTQPEVSEPLCIFYGTIDFVDLVINLKVDREPTFGRPRLPKSLVDNIRAVPDKIQTIKSMDGLPAVLKKIEMTGKNGVERVKVTYEQNERDIVKTYTVNQFYKL
jgi:hypothetical protein